MEKRTNYKFRCGFTWDLGLSWESEYWNGPFTSIRIGWFWMLFNWDGLPYIFQEDIDA